MNHYFKLQTSGKRFLAGFLDFVFVFLLGIILYIPAVHITNAAGWAASYQELYKYGISSGLYIPNDAGGFDTIGDYEKMPKALYDFYVDHFDKDEGGQRVRRFDRKTLVEGHEFNTTADFYDVILKRGSPDTLFTFPEVVSEKYEPEAAKAKNINSPQTQDFLFTEMSKAYDLFNEYPIVNQLLFDNIRYQAITIVSAYLVSAFLLIVLLPLVLKDKVTLGKLVTSTIVLNRFGYKITNGRAFARNLSVFLLSFVFFFLPFHLASFLFGMFTKKKESLFDMIAFTIVADKKTSIPFANVEEETIYRKKLANSLLTIEKRRAENRQNEIAEKRDNSESSTALNNG